MKRVLILCLLLAPLTASAADVTLADLMRKAASPANQQKMRQAMVTAQVLGCTEEKAGKEQARLFYKEIQSFARETHALCKQGQVEEAKAMVIAQARRTQKSPVTPALEACLDQMAPEIAAAIGKPEITARIPQYRSWMRDPNRAEREITKADACW